MQYRSIVPGHVRPPFVYKLQGKQCYLFRIHQGNLNKFMLSIHSWEKLELIRQRCMQTFNFNGCEAWIVPKIFSQKVQTIYFCSLKKLLLIPAVAFWSMSTSSIATGNLSCKWDLLNTKPMLSRIIWKAFWQVTLARPCELLIALKQLNQRKQSYFVCTGKWKKGTPLLKVFFHSSIGLITFSRFL